MPIYRSILKQSFRFTTKHKRLWFIGFWVALLGNGGEYEIFVRNTQEALSTHTSIAELPRFFMQSFISDKFIMQLQNLALSLNPLTSFALLIVFAALIYLGITAQGVLIKSIYQSTKLKKQPAIKDTWIKTRAKFFELFIATLFFKGGGFIIALLISFPFALLLNAITQISFGSSAFIMGLLIFTPLAIIVSFLVKYTLIFIIVKNYDPLTALESSVKLFKENWLITIENALLLFILNLTLGFAALIAALIISFPIIAAISLIVYPRALPDGYYITIIAWISMLLLPIFGSALAVFQYSSWTILWGKLLSPRKMQSKLSRIAAVVNRKLL